MIETRHRKSIKIFDVGEEYGKENKPAMLLQQITFFKICILFTKCILKTQKGYCEIKKLKPNEKQNN